MFDDIKKREINTYPKYIFSNVFSNFFILSFLHILVTFILYKGKYLYPPFIKAIFKQVKKGSFKEIIIWFKDFLLVFYFPLTFKFSLCCFYLCFSSILFFRSNRKFICEIIWRIIYLQKVLRDKFDLFFLYC